MAQTRLKPIVLDMITDDDIEGLRIPIDLPLFFRTHT